MTSRVRVLSTTVFVRPKAGSLIPVSDLDEAGIFFEMVALRCFTVATVPNEAISTAVRKGEVRFMFLS